MFPANNIIEIKDREGHNFFMTRQTSVKIGDMTISDTDELFHVTTLEEQMMAEKGKYLVLLPAILPINI